MDWFETLTGFQETSYAETRARLEIAGGELRSLVNGARYGIGDLELVSLRDLRDRAKSSDGSRGRLRVGVVEGDIMPRLWAPENAGALFQVASQFNLLEMISPGVTPEDGVTRYQCDKTQGPACAIAAGAATLYRNFFVPVDGIAGQTAARQLDGLADVGATLSGHLNMPVSDLWSMRNGYAMASHAGLDAITRCLGTLTQAQVESLRGDLRIGVHRDVEVTQAPGPDRPRVSQAFCSALPVGYGRIVPESVWAPFARLVLEAAFEATLWAGLLNARRGVSNVVFLTPLGGGAFGNRGDWIAGAMRRALDLVRPFDLDVRIVSYHAPSHEILALVEAFR